MLVFYNGIHIVLIKLTIKAREMKADDVEAINERLPFYGRSLELASRAYFQFVSKIIFITRYGILECVLTPMFI